MGTSYKIRVAYFVIKERRKRKEYLRREGRRVNGLQGLDDVNHGKVPACSMGFRYQVSGYMSIIRGMDCPRIRM